MFIQFENNTNIKTMHNICARDPDYDATKTSMNFQRKICQVRLADHSTIIKYSNARYHLQY